MVAASPAALYFSFCRVVLLVLGSTSALSAADYQSGASSLALSAPPVVVSNAGYRLVIDSTKGGIVSLRSTFGTDRELLIPNHAHLPLFKLELMNDNSEFKTITSSQAKEITIRKTDSGREQKVIIEFNSIADMPVDARVTIRCPENEALTYWNIELTNGTPSWIANLQFPLVEVPFDDLMGRDLNKILWSFGDGVLTGPVTPSMSLGGWSGTIHDNSEIWRYNNYPGQWTTTQLMAYYNDVGGLYMACDDATGLPKMINPLMENDGIRLGMGHFPGTRGPGTFKLPYNVVIGTFHGDWYTAAEIYRNWAEKQLFCSAKLAQRKDYPKWISDPVVGIAFPMRGQADFDPPATVNPEYSPATNALPYLEKLAADLKCPLMPIVFNWESAGPWVQPDAFPPLGGDASMLEFMKKAKQKGWHPCLYGDGLAWVTYQKNTNYDGMPYFKSRDGEVAVTRKWDRSFLEDKWDWRRNYVACVGTEKGRGMIVTMTKKMSEFGPDVIQQFDEGAGPRACYASDHGHPPVPGPWMAIEFKKLLSSVDAAARSNDSGVAMSVEGAPPECYLQEFQTWDARASTCPLYSFLYHEYGNGHEGFYMNRVNDEALRLSIARAIVTGYMVNITLREQGLIGYDWDQLWTRAIPDQTGVIDWTKRSSHFRAGIARDYLVFGRMLRPWKVSNLTEHDLGWGKEPLVQSATWQASDGRIGIVLANCSDQSEAPRIELEGHGTKDIVVYLDGQQIQRREQLPNVLDINMAPRSLCLIEVK
jgi:hypothetical protein